MPSLNMIMLIGNLASDVRTKQGNGTTLGTFRLAVNHYVAPGKQESLFVSVDVAGSTAESCARYLTKGRLVLVEGRLRCRKYQDPQGAACESWEVVASRVLFLSPKEGGTRPQRGE